MEGVTTGAATRLRPLRRLGDDELAAAAAGDDPRAFGVVFERYHEPLYRYFDAMLGDPDLAAAALQKTMLAAMRGLKAGERTIALRPWLHGLAHDQALAQQEPNRATAAEGLAAQIAGLPERERSALLLHEMNGLEYAELAAALAITTNEAREAVLAARRALEPAGAARTEACDAMQAELSANDGRLQRRRDIRAHVAGCPDCAAFAAALAERPRELRKVFALPEGVEAAVVGAGEAAIGADVSEGADHPTHRALLASLVLLVVLGSVAALAALGTFEPDRGGTGERGAAGPGATRVQVEPGGARPAPGGAGPRSARKAPRAPNASAGSAAPSAPATGAPAAGSRPAGPNPIRSAVSAYTTPGERTEAALDGH
jgi:RNA polymerase sigma-70 factor (ECF subfamily)